MPLKKIKKIFSKSIAYVFNLKLLLISAFLSIAADYLSKSNIGFFNKTIAEYASNILGIYSSFGFSVILFKKLKKIKKITAFCVCIFIDLVILGLLFLLPNITNNLIFKNIFGIIFLTAVFLTLFLLIYLAIKPALWLKNQFLSLIKSGFFKKSLKLFSKLLLIFVCFMLLFIIIFNQNIPAFIYNEMEWKVRADYLLAEKAKEDINVMIAVQKKESDLLLTDNQLFKLPDNLSKAKEVRQFFIEDYEKINNKQAKIPFLPKKYQKYQKLKTEGFINYQKGFEAFIQSSDYQNQVFTMVHKLDSLDEMLFNYLMGKSNWDPNLILASNLSKEIQQMYDDKIINQELKDFFDFRTKRLTDSYEFLINPDNNLVTKEKTDNFGSILLRKTDLPDTTTIILNWDKEIILKLREQMDNFHKIAFEQFTQADQYYKDNNLKNDLISKILSKFSSRYPKTI